MGKTKELLLPDNIEDMTFTEQIDILYHNVAVLNEPYSY